MSSYIPYNDFQSYCREHWDELGQLTVLFKINWLFQTKVIYKRFRGNFEKLKNCVKLISLYQAVIGKVSIPPMYHAEVRYAVNYMSMQFGSLLKSHNTIRSELLVFSEAFPQFCELHRKDMQKE